MSETLLYRRVYYEYVGVAYEKHINCSSDADPAPKFCLQKSALKNLQTKQKYENLNQYRDTRVGIGIVSTPVPDLHLISLV